MDKIYTEQQEKARAYEAQAANEARYEPKRESLSARFRSQESRLRRDQQKLDQLGELTFLLEKNPEIARILDLVDELGRDY